ncbi:hypothetical protein BSKO_08725 [Bryopsis sp. KO-2023]|nr:hypothetical protein BSKO_08725 [Bryopsis sp. KO-2023]
MLRFRLTKTSQLVLQQGDLTRWRGDAIVNAANEVMLGGGGVDGAIHRAAGPKLRKACREVEPVRGDIRCPTGEARVTKAFDLPVEYVIHTVGPIYAGQTESEPLLEAAYRNSLIEANKLGISKVAFPAISCGIFRYPLQDAAQVSLTAIEKNVADLKEVHFVFFERSTMRVFVEKARYLFDETDEAGQRKTPLEKKRKQEQPEREDKMDVDPNENEAMNGVSGDAEDGMKKRDSQASDGSQVMDETRSVESEGVAADQTGGMVESQSTDGMPVEERSLESEIPKEVGSNQAAREISPDTAAEKPHSTDTQEEANGRVDNESKEADKKDAGDSNEEVNPEERGTEFTDHEERENGEAGSDIKGAEEKVVDHTNGGAPEEERKTEL